MFTHFDSGYDNRKCPVISVKMEESGSQVGPGQLGQVNSACMGAQVWGKGGLAGRWVYLYVYLSVC